MSDKAKPFETRTTTTVTSDPAILRCTHCNRLCIVTEESVVFYQEEQTGVDYATGRPRMPAIYGMSLCDHCLRRVRRCAFCVAFELDEKRGAWCHRAPVKQRTSEVNWCREFTQRLLFEADEIEQLLGLEDPEDPAGAGLPKGVDRALGGWADEIPRRRGDA